MTVDTNQHDTSPTTREVVYDVKDVVLRFGGVT